MLSKNSEIFSPQNFTQYIGQNRAKQIASVLVQSSKIQNKPLSNMLISGPWGTGKTSLAKVIRLETGKSIKIVDASSISSIGDLGYDKSVIIDEIHNLDPKVADSLNILIDQGTSSIIGCTTNPGALSSAFKSRFRSIELERYNLSDMRQIITHASVRKGIRMDGKTIADVANRSRLNPRTAINNLAFIFDYMVVKGALYVAPRLAQEAFETLGIDTNGFTKRDYEYMSILSDKPLGVSNLSSRLGIDPQTIEKEIEPYLLQTGYIDRMPRGRIKLKDI